MSRPVSPIATLTNSTRQWTWGDPLFSISVFTKFYLYKTAAPCYINVTHAPAGRGKGNHSTRVRLDMLGLKLASCALHCELTTRLATKHWGATVRNRCWKNRTQPGYLSPACFEKAPVCTLAKLHPEYDD